QHTVATEELELLQAGMKTNSWSTKLTVIPPEAEGILSKLCELHQQGAKPLFTSYHSRSFRHLSPLPPDSQHFSKMPKKTCYQCNEVMPCICLQYTLRHARENSPPMRLVKSDFLSISGGCPICTKEFPDNEITFHASLCGESNLLCSALFDTTTEFKLCVDREDLPDRGILQWKRKKAASPASVLKVVYIEEAGIDTGALRKTGNQDKNPKYSLTDLDNENFRTIGEIMSVNLAQGGPPPAFLRGWCYNFLCTGENHVNSSCLMLNADEIISSGYTSQINLDSKESIIRAIVLHSTTRLIPMLQQIRKGMELYGLVDQMATNPEACRSLFVPREDYQAHFSEKGTSKGRTERKITTFLEDFLQEVEMSDGETDSAAGDTEPLAVPHVLQWITGQERLGDHSVCYPIVSACTQTVTFPVQHLSTYTDFRRIMSEAVKYGGSRVL
uniref:HECT domain-containing protein n=1 Tax=Sander lucioperca TaxID=283035 RepID=A0A8D0A0R7_SANLU